MVLIIVCILAGLGAGIGTGLAGLSAAVVITPHANYLLRVYSLRSGRNCTGF